MVLPLPVSVAKMDGYEVLLMGKRQTDTALNAGGYHTGAGSGLCVAFDWPSATRREAAVISQQPLLPPSRPPGPCSRGTEV